MRVRDSELAWHGSFAWLRAGVDFLLQCVQQRPDDWKTRLQAVCSLIGNCMGPSRGFCPYSACVYLRVCVLPVGVESLYDVRTRGGHTSLE